MKYTPILLKDGSAYLAGTPEYATEKSLCLQDKLILELNDKINQLETDKLEMAKALYEISNMVGVSAKYLDLMDKVEKYIKEVEK